MGALALSVAVVLVFAACDGLFGGLGGETKGLVEFYNNVRYDQGAQQLVFTAIMQYEDYERHDAVDIDYDVLDGSTVILSGSEPANSYDESGMYWKTDEVRVSISASTYSGKDITVFLDPDGALTADQWQASENERKQVVTIP